VKRIILNLLKTPHYYVIFSTLNKIGNLLIIKLFKSNEYFFFNFENFNRELKKMSTFYESF